MGMIREFIQEKRRNILGFKLKEQHYISLIGFTLFVLLLTEQLTRQQGPSSAVSLSHHGTHEVIHHRKRISSSSISTYNSNNNNYLKKHASYDAQTKKRKKCWRYHHEPEHIKILNPYLWINHPEQAAGDMERGDGKKTFQHRLENEWRITLRECHASPCIDKFPDISGHVENELTQEWYINHREDVSQIPGSFIIVRDPVDRFVSAFHERSLLLCRNDSNNNNKKGGGKDNRIKANYETAYQNPTEFCERTDHLGEWKILFEKYGGEKDNFFSINNLAESLCDDSSGGEKSNIKKKDIQHVKHIHHEMVDFLPPDWSTNNLVYENLIPIVHEQHFDFDKILDDTIMYGLEKFKILSREEVMERRKYVDCVSSEDESSDNQLATYDHSSSKNSDFFLSSTKPPVPALSEKGMFCAVEYFKKDYEFLEVLLYKGCKSGDCVAAIESILERRSELLHKLK